MILTKLSSLAFSILICIANAVGQTKDMIASKQDSIAIKNTAWEFSRLVLMRGNIDSITKYCKAPFFVVGKKPGVFSSLVEIKKYLRKVTRSKTSPSEYRIDNVYIDSKPQGIPEHLKSKAVFVTIVVRFYHMGEGDSEQLVNGVLFVTKSPPYKIVGFKE
jgi:hypothetical protein